MGSDQQELVLRVSNLDRWYYPDIARSALSIENLPVVPSSKVTPKQRVV
jgi:hypothetical protein